MDPRSADYRAEMGLALFCRIARGTLIAFTGGHSVENPYEAREIIGILKEIAASEAFVTALVSAIEEDELPIGVICMYADQKRLLQKLLSEQDWATSFRRFIKIDTV